MMKNCLVILKLFLCVTCLEMAACELYTNINDIKLLSDLEDKHLEKLENHITQSEGRLRNLKRLLSEIKPGEKTAANTSADDIVGQPVSAYHVIKTWRLLTNLAVPHFSASDNVKESLVDFGDLVPTENDINGSMEALLRLQVMYNLTTKDLAEGLIQGQMSSHPLTAQDCFDIGLKAQELRELSLAAEWFEQAKNKTSLLTMKQSALYHMATCSEQVGHTTRSYKAALEVFHGEEPDLNCVDIDPSCETFVESNFCSSTTHKARTVCPASCGFCASATNVLFYNELVRLIARTRAAALTMIQSSETEGRPQPATVEGYEHLCRSNVLGNSNLYIKKDLLCKYYTNSVEWYRFKLEVFSISPFVSIVYDVINDSEAHYIQNISKSKLTTSYVLVSANTTKMSKGRISKQCWLKDEYDPLVARITKRIEAITGLNLTYKNTVETPNGLWQATSSDSLQVVNYGIGGHYHAHLDTLLNHQMYPQLSPRNLTGYSGDRIATIMLYLNHVASGGNTVFPILNISITPVKNAAVFWYNSYPSGINDHRTLHGGCPVLLGEKWVANKWVRELSNEFTRKCGLHLDSLQNF